MSKTLLFTSAHIEGALNTTCTKGIRAFGVSIDTRTIERGDIFVALQGNQSGHKFVYAAFEKGCACAIVGKNFRSTKLSPEQKELLIYVDDTSNALRRLAAFARGRFSGTAIAITGSVGKTTTKNMMAMALAPYGTVHAAKGSYNNHIGVPLTIANLPPLTDYAIFEIGMNHPNEILPLAKMVRPSVAVITSVESTHIGNMKNIEEIAQEKFSIFSALSNDKKAVVAEDVISRFPTFLERYQSTVSLSAVGHSDKSKYRIEKTQLLSDESQFGLSINHTFPLQCSLSAVGDHLINDAALCIATVNELGLNPSESVTALKSFSGTTGRGLVHHLANGVLLIDESYNASPASMKAALNSLNHISNGNRQIAVLGDMKELGSQSGKAHKKIIEELIGTQTLVFACGTEFQKPFNSLPEELQGGWTETSKALATLVGKQVKENDVVMVKGSNSMDMNHVIKQLMKLKKLAK